MKYFVFTEMACGIYPKVRPKETTEQTEQQVCEEIGLNRLFAHGFVSHGIHTNTQKGTVLKQTYWYTMHTEFEQHLLPQIEEGITDIAWVSRKDIDMIKTNVFFYLVMC